VVRRHAEKELRDNMKVLKIIHTRGHGGAENTFRWLAWGLKREGVEVVAAVPDSTASSGDNWIIPALGELEIPCVTFDKSGSPKRLLASVSALIDRVRPDIVHSHLLDSNFYSSLACWRKSVPHVCTEHGDVFLVKTRTAKVKYFLLSVFSSFVLCVSDSVREKTCRFVPFRRKLRTVHNGFRFFERGPSTFRQEAGIPHNAVVIGSVGNLYPVKGHRHLIRAFAEVLASCPESYLVIVGRGQEEKTLRSQVAELGAVGGRILLTGFRSDVQNIMNSIDLYVQPSLSEGHPVAVLEAMSLGIPVVASAVGGIPELFQSQKYGTLSTAGSWEDLYGTISRYLADPGSFREKAVEAREHVLANYSIQKMTSNYLSFYEKALARER
jgi:glycosyltransferase involved in cell wall biosynthesis